MSQAETLDDWLRLPTRDIRTKRGTHGVNEAVSFTVVLLQNDRAIAAGYGPDEASARADVWERMPERWKRDDFSKPFSFPLDPFFIECVRRAAANKELVAQFDRLQGTNLSLSGSRIERAIDKATGRSDDDIKKFLEFVKEFVYERIALHE